MRSVILSGILIALLPLLGAQYDLGSKAVLISSGGGAIPAFVTSSTFGSSVTNTDTQSIACASGDSAVIFVAQVAATGETMSLTTATGNTLTPISAVVNVGTAGTVSAWQINNCNGTTGNYTYGDLVGTFPAIFFIEMSGTTHSGYLDGVVVCNITLSDVCGTITTTGPNDLTIGAGFSNNGGAAWGGAPGTPINGTAGTVLGWYNTSISPGTYTFGATYAGGPPYIIVYLGVK